MAFFHFSKHKLNNFDVTTDCKPIHNFLSLIFLPRLQCNKSRLRELKPSSVSLSQTTSKGFTFTLPSPSSSLCSICPPPPFPHPVRGWINVWLWETCRWQMFTFIMHDFHVAVNFSEPAKSRKWFCTLCLFNEIVTLMEVRLNKMEMTVSVCRFYDLFFFYRNQFSHHHPHPVFMDQCNTQGVETDGGRNSVGSLEIIHLLTVGGVLSMFSIIFSNI